MVGKIRLNLSRAYFFEGQVYYSQNEMGKARSAFHKALEINTSLDPNQEILTFRGQQRYSLGMTYLGDNQIDESLELLHQAKEDYLSAKQYEQGIEILFRLATINKKLGNYPSAIEYLQEVQDYKRSISDKKERNTMLGRTKLELGRIYNITGKDNAEKELKKAKKLFSKASDTQLVVECLVALAALKESSDPVLSHEYLMEAKDLAKTTDSSSTKGLVYTKLGITSLKQGEFKQGKELLVKGLKYRTEAGDTIGTAETLVELARISLITSRNDENLKNAEKFASQALKLYEENNLKYGMATSLELLGSINTKLENFSLAKKQIQQGKKIFEDYNDKNGEGRMMTQLGLILDQQSQHQEAIVVLEKATELFDETSNKQGKAEALHVLAMQYKDDPKRAIDLLQQSRELYSVIIGGNKQLGIILQSIDSTIERLRQN